MCLVSIQKSTEVNINLTRACKNFAVHRPRKEILFKDVRAKIFHSIEFF